MASGPDRRNAVPLPGFRPQAIGGCCHVVKLVNPSTYLKTGRLQLVPLQNDNFSDKTEKSP